MAAGEASPQRGSSAMRSDPEPGSAGPVSPVDRRARALRRRAAWESWAARSSEWWVGRGAAAAVVVAWVAIVAVVLVGWLSWDAAAFVAVGAFTFAVAVVLAFDAAVDWFDPDERGSLP